MFMMFRMKKYVNVQVFNGSDYVKLPQCCKLQYKTIFVHETSFFVLRLSLAGRDSPSRGRAASQLGSYSGAGLDGGSLGWPQGFNWSSLRISLICYPERQA